MPNAKAGDTVWVALEVDLEEGDPQLGLLGVYNDVPWWADQYVEIPHLMEDALRTHKMYSASDVSQRVYYSDNTPDDFTVAIELPVLDYRIDLDTILTIAIIDEIQEMRGLTFQSKGIWV